MKKVTKHLVVLLSLAVVMATLVIVAGASSGNVAKVGGKEYETIAEALDAAEAGDEVVVITISSKYLTVISRNAR